ncbi:hypothetical protein V2G26_009996 [Clonostachys chloroleuca]
MATDHGPRTTQTSRGKDEVNAIAPDRAERYSIIHIALPTLSSSSSSTSFNPPIAETNIGNLVRSAFTVHSDGNSLPISTVDVEPPCEQLSARDMYLPSTRSILLDRRLCHQLDRKPATQAPGQVLTARPLYPDKDGQTQGTSTTDEPATGTAPQCIRKSKRA